MRKFGILFLMFFIATSLIACHKINQSSEKMDSNDNRRITHFDIGDIILADGSMIKAKEFTYLDHDNLPIAIIVDFNEDGTVLGIGVHHSEVSLAWAVDESFGYKTQFQELIADSDSENAETADFIGDRDGSDNWKYICLHDQQNEESDSNDYPAFQFVNTYAKRYDLTHPFASDWYMPSIEELCTIYKNRHVIDDSLQKIYELDHQVAMNGLGTNWYWSSSQSQDHDDYAWFVHYYNGYVCDCPKNFTNLYVLAVCKF